jgi:hypothetical protein
MEIQLGWIREIGFVDVDCYCKWLEMALLIGYKAKVIVQNYCISRLFIF